MKDQNFVKEAKIFLGLLDSLVARGFKKKDIAEELQVFPSAFSSLVNRVLKKIVNLHPPIEKHQISSIFLSVNNVSELNIRRNLNIYNQQLQTLLEKSTTNKYTDNTAPHAFFEDLLTDPPGFLWNHLEGIYHCYYLSTFGYQMKCEPFMMKKTGAHLTVFKGNDSSPAKYKGLAYLSNHQLLTIHLQEENAVSKDHFIIHFQLPPSYNQTLKMLRGISLSMANSFQPLARKIVIKKRYESPTTRNFQEMPTRFYEPTEAEDHPIISYLRHGTHILELLSIPHPSYKEQDLEYEKKMLEFLSD